MTLMICWRKTSCDFPVYLRDGDPAAVEGDTEAAQQGLSNREADTSAGLRVQGAVRGVGILRSAVVLERILRPGAEALRQLKGSGEGVAGGDVGAGFQGSRFPGGHVGKAEAAADEGIELRNRGACGPMLKAPNQGSRRERSIAWSFAGTRDHRRWRGPMLRGWIRRRQRLREDSRGRPRRARECWRLPRLRASAGRMVCAMAAISESASSILALGWKKTLMTPTPCRIAIRYARCQ